MVSRARRRTTRRFQTMATVVKIAKIDRALIRKPNSRVDVLLRELVCVLVGNAEGSADGIAGDWVDMAVESGRGRTQAGVGRPILRTAALICFTAFRLVRLGRGFVSITSNRPQSVSCNYNFIRRKPYHHPPSAMDTRLVTTAQSVYRTHHCGSLFSPSSHPPSNP